MKILIDIDYFTNSTVIAIADELGCDIEYPDTVFPKDNSKEAYEKSVRENDKKFYEYIYNVRKWLKTYEYKGEN